jgi:hypothetical protein
MRTAAGIMAGGASASRPIGVLTCCITPNTTPPSTGHR